MYSAEEALDLGLVQAVADEDQLLVRAGEIASNLSAKHPPAFAGIKALLRQPVADEMVRREAASIRDFVEIWYAEATWANIQDIKIH
jgi:enoyl-CoA hydratase/carnithine racemase